MYLMNHRSVLNGTPLDARHTNVALVAREPGYEPALFGYTDTSVDPRTVGPDDPRLRTYEGVLPGFDPVGYLPEGNPAAWLDWMRAAGDRRRPTTGAPSSTNRPRAHGGAPSTTPSTARPCSSPIACSTSSTTGRRPGSPGSRTSRTCDRTRRSSRPPPTTRCSIPRRCPTRCARATRAEEGAQHPLLGVMIDHPFVASPDDPQEQTRAAGDLLRDDGRGRRAARPRLRRARRDRPRVAHARRAHLGPRRDARRPLDPAQARLVRPDLPRAADRARSSPAVRRDARPGRRARSPSTSTCCRRSPSCSTPRCRCSATDARSRRGSTARLPTDWRTRSALRVRLPRSRRRHCSKARSASRSRSARSRCSATTTASTCTSRATRRCRRSSSTSTTDPAQIVNRAADPAYAANGARLRAAHARLADAPRRTHAHRDEAHRPQRPGRAPLTPDVAPRPARKFLPSGLS